MPERSVRTFQFLNPTVTAPGTAQRLTAYYVPDGFTVYLVNPLNSTGNFYAAETAAKAQSGARKRIEPGQSVPFKVDNTSRIFIDADNSTDALEVYVGDEVSGQTPA